MTKPEDALKPAGGTPVDRPVVTPAPVRAVRLTLKLDADDLHELACALYAIAHHAERGELTTGCSGGPSSGYIYELLQDPTITHDSYHAALRAYLEDLKRPNVELSGPP